MKRSIVLLICLLAFAASAVKPVNSRNVPEAEDFSTFGNAFQFELYDTILSEILPIMSTGRNVDAIDVDSVRTSYLFGSPALDSISGTVGLDTVFVGAGLIGIAKIDTMGNADTIMIILNTGDSLMIAKDR